MIIPCHSMIVMFNHGCQPGYSQLHFSDENARTNSALYSHGCRPVTRTDFFRDKVETCGCF